MLFVEHCLKRARVGNIPMISGEISSVFDDFPISCVWPKYLNIIKYCNSGKTNWSTTKINKIIYVPNDMLCDWI